jgi:hypothetical protein
MERREPSSFHHRHRLRRVQFSLRGDQSDSAPDCCIARGTIVGQAPDCSDLGGQFGLRFAASLAQASTIAGTRPAPPPAYQRALPNSARTGSTCRRRRGNEPRAGGPQFNHAAVASWKQPRARRRMLQALRRHQSPQKPERATVQWIHSSWSLRSVRRLPTQ